jgi:4-amino-4-deoxy-L-arabinose transferase-like glycosyltransferase
MDRTFTRPWILIYLLLAMACWGARPLWEPDEGRYAETARELLFPVNVADLTTGTLTAGVAQWRIDLGDGPSAKVPWGLLQLDDQRDWLVPRLQGKPHLTKPPLTYWLSAAGMALLGVNEWGARLFLGLAFFATILATVALARNWGWSLTEARAAGLIYGSAVVPFAAGHVLTTDTFLACWETLGVLACWQAWRGGPRAAWWRWGFWLAFGLAFLTKGPPGWLPLLVMLIFRLVRRKTWGLPGRVWSWGGLLLMLLVGLSWFVAVCQRQPALYQYFLGYELVERIASTTHKRNSPFWMYLPVLLAGLFPWIALWPTLLRTAWRRVLAWRGWGDLEWFTALWLAVPFMVFTLSQSRMVFYVLPLFVPLALWAGRAWVAWCGGEIWPVRPVPRRWATIGAVAWGLGLLVFVNYPAGAPPSRTQKVLARELMRNDPAGHYQIFTEDDSGNSLSFYTGRRLVWLDRSFPSQLNLVRKETLVGRPAALEIGRRRMEKKLPADYKYKILAESKRDVIIAPLP